MTDSQNNKLETLQERVAWVLAEVPGSVDDISNKIGVNRNTFFAYKKGKGTLKGIVLENLVLIYGVNPNWLLAGEGAAFRSATLKALEDSETNELNSTLQKLQKTVANFKNRTKGLENNKRLVGIEDNSEELYEKVSDYIKATHDAIQSMKKKYQKGTTTFSDSKDQKSGLEQEPAKI